jgi:hypothetical protein
MKCNCNCNTIANWVDFQKSRKWWRQRETLEWYRFHLVKIVWFDEKEVSFHHEIRFVVYFHQGNISFLGQVSWLTVSILSPFSTAYFLAIFFYIEMIYFFFCKQNYLLKQKMASWITQENTRILENGNNQGLDINLCTIVTCYLYNSYTPWKVFIKFVCVLFYTIPL